jgi:hypothetical protein
VLAGGGKFLPLVDTASGTLQLALPLILGALAGVLGERSGVVNVAIEGQFLMGAFGAALVGTMARSVWAGLVSAAVGGVLIAALLAVLAIRFLVDQVVVGIVLNLLALGVTGFLYERLMQPNAQSFKPAAPDADLAGAGPVRHPGDRPGAVQLQPAGLAGAAARGRRPPRTHPHPMGPADPGGRRAPHGGGHGRHPGARAAHLTC